MSDEAVASPESAMPEEGERKPSDAPSTEGTVVILEEETEAVVEGGDDEEERETFGSKVSYILTLVGYAVGFGNVWRFPYLLQNNGGVAFLIPYVLALTFMGIPTFFLEVAIGQRLHKGPVGVWNEISPYLAGIGVMSALLCLLVGLYYTTLIAWCLTYFADIFRPTLRWTSCDTAVKDWATSHLDIDCRASNNGSRNDSVYFLDAPHGGNFKESCEICEETGASLYYWNYEILNISKSITDLGEFNPWIFVALIVSWIIIWAILFKGLKAQGKVVYVSALFPYAVLFIFLVTGLSLPGMQNGFRVLFTPDWSKLANANTWMAAGTQIFFSLGIGFGSLIAFASHLPSKNDCYRDAVSVALINCSTSLFAAMVIFSILGFRGTALLEVCKTERFSDFEKKILYNQTLLKTFLRNGTDDGIQNLIDIAMSKVRGKLKTYDADWIEHTDVFEGVIDRYTVGNSTERQLLPLPLQRLQEDPSFPKLRDCSIASAVGSAGGTGLVFVVFADAIAQLPASQFFAFLFYLMLFTLGIDSAFGTIEGAISGFEDLKLKIKRWLLTTIVVGSLGVVGSILFSFGWGQYLLSFFDEFCANWTLLTVALFECIGIAWVYGLKRFAYDIKLMTGHRPTILMLVCWKYISPILMFSIMIATISGYITNGIGYDLWETSENDKGKFEGKRKFVPFPPVFMALGFTIALCAVLPIPIIAILKYFNISPLKEEVPAHFPEEELQEAVNFVSHDEEAKSYTTSEKAMFWGDPDTLSKKSTTSVAMQSMSDPGVGNKAPGSQTSV